MKAFDVVVLTDPRYVSPKETNQYIENVLLEDQLVLDALESKGIRAIKVAWDDSDFDWYSTRYALFRTTWDYFERFDEFFNWLNRVKNQTMLLNSESLILWNIDKHYLNDLAQSGVNIPPTIIIEKETNRSLLCVCDQFENETEFVLKPCISGAARHTYRFHRDEIESYKALFSTLIAEEAMMLQVFQHHIVEQGEVSLMFFGETYSHAVLKVAKPGDFRVQDDFGGAVHDYTPSEEEITFALNAVKSCPELPIYARVDIFRDNDHQLALAELELIEPELWFRRRPQAADLLAEQIKKRIQL